MWNWVVYLDGCIAFHCISVPQFIYSTVDRQTGCFQFGDISSDAIMSICIQDIFWGGEGCMYVCISAVYTFRSRTAGSLGKKYSASLDITKQFSK